jgi:hypothetical protein
MASKLKQAKAMLFVVLDAERERRGHDVISGAADRGGFYDFFARVSRRRMAQSSSSRESQATSGTFPF